MAPALTANDPLGIAVLVLVGAIAAGINSVAGGGTLISFPVLTQGFSIPLREANATNAVALWPGSLAGAIGFLKQLEKTRHALWQLLPSTIVGSALGAWLLVNTSERAFEGIVPWLILIATLLLAFQPQVRAFVTRRHKVLPMWFGWLVQFLVAVYGGYFGAGMGIMMLGAFALILEGNIHELNAVKTWLGLVINFAATVMFMAQGLVVWAPLMALVIGSMIGGYAAARMSLKVDAEKLRIAIVVYGVVMCGFFFSRAFA